MKNLLGFAAVAALSLAVPQFAFAAPAAGDLDDQATQAFVLYWPAQASTIEVAKDRNQLRESVEITLQNSGRTHESRVDY